MQNIRNPTEIYLNSIFFDGMVFKNASACFYMIYLQEKKHNVKNVTKFNFIRWVFKNLLFETKTKQIADKFTKY